MVNGRFGKFRLPYIDKWDRQNVPKKNYKGSEGSERTFVFLKQTYSLLTRRWRDWPLSFTTLTRSSDWLVLVQKWLPWRQEASCKVVFALCLIYWNHKFWVCFCGNQARFVMLYVWRCWITFSCTWGNENTVKQENSIPSQNSLWKENNCLISRNKRENYPN